MIGKTVSHYKILEKIGEGGMGVVYLAEDTKLDRQVALKFLPSKIKTGENDKKRFLQEAKAAAALNHPNICVIHDISEHEGAQFIVMEYVQGQTLKEILISESLKLSKVIDYALQIADALQTTHSKDIIHRDIKSENIMITSTDQIKVMDFGLAKLKGAVKLSKTSSTSGTVGYMSPECIQGREIDTRSDIFSFGILLYEMLTGKLPFTGDYEAAVIYSILNDEPEPIQQYRSDISSELLHVLNRALEKGPGERYQTVNDMLIDLNRLKRDTSRVTRKSLIEAPVPDITSKPKPVKISKSPSMKIRISIGIMIFLIIAGYIFFIKFIAPPKPETPVGERKKIVVLPFENLGSPEDEYFADGITEETTARLSVIQDLGVIARTSAVKYKNTNKSIKQIGRELDVEYILEGTIRWQRFPEGLSRVRITPQLIKVSDATHLWSSTYDKDMADIFQIQTDIAEQVAKALDIKLFEPERKYFQAKPTSNPAAYDYYLRGIDHYMQGFSNDDNKKFEIALEMHEKAVELDPDFAMAYIRISTIHSWMYFDGYDHTGKRLARSKEAVDEALRLKPDMPEALIALAYYYYRGFLDYDRALKLFKKVQKARPNSSPALVGFIQRRQGKWNESVKTIEKSFSQNPRFSLLADEQALTFTNMRRYQDALEWRDRALSIDPDYLPAQVGKALIYLLWKGNTKDAQMILKNLPKQPIVNNIWFLLYKVERNYQEALNLLNSLSYDSYKFQNSYFEKNLAYASLYYLHKRMLLMQTHADSARILIEKEVQNNPDDPRIRAALGLAYAYLGQKEKAIKEGNRAVELHPISKDALSGPNYFAQLTQIYALVGEHETAIDNLEYMLSIPNEDVSVSLLNLDPIWDVLRDYPRFKALLKKEK